MKPSPSCFLDHKKSLDVQSVFTQCCSVPGKSERTLQFCELQKPGRRYRGVGIGHWYQSTQNFHTDNSETNTEQKMRTLIALSCSLLFTATLSLPFSRIGEQSGSQNEIQKEDIELSPLGVALIRCCSSTMDTFHQVARCFEVNGFGGINFSKSLCSFLPDVV